MHKKLRLDVEGLSVESFEVTDESAGVRGTVRAAQEEIGGGGGGGGGGCTNGETCDCPTAYYRCVEFMYTDYSCDYGTVPIYTPRC
ncbi:MAG TPA: hypothetical protein VEY93_15535 [Longimicrobium sp.]|nr:hypothetical protein [Longimicrobium sp.]